MGTNMKISDVEHTMVIHDSDHGNGTRNPSKTKIADTNALHANNAFWTKTNPCSGHHGHPRIHVLYLPRDKLKLCKNADLVSNKKGPLVVWFIIGNWSDPGILFNWEYLQLMGNPKNHQPVERDVDAFSQLRVATWFVFFFWLLCLASGTLRRGRWVDLHLRSRETQHGRPAHPGVWTFVLEGR